MSEGEQLNASVPWKPQQHSQVNIIWWEVGLEERKIVWGHLASKENPMRVTLCALIVGG